MKFSDTTLLPRVDCHRAFPVVVWHNGVWRWLASTGSTLGQAAVAGRRLRCAARIVGRRLRAHDLGALTGVGIASIIVHRQPRIGLISTGDEIVDAAEVPLPGQVRNINQHSLAGLFQPGNKGRSLEPSAATSHSEAELLGGFATVNRNRLPSGDQRGQYGLPSTGNHLRDSVPSLLAR